MFAERDLDNGNGDLFRGDAAVCGHHVREELRKVCGRFARLDGAICRRRCKAEHGQFVRIIVIVVIFLRRGRGDVLGGQALRPCIILLHESDRLFLRHADADGVHRDGAEGRSRPVDDLDVQDFSDVRARVDVLAQHIFGKFGIFKVLRGGNDKEFFVRFAVADGDVNVILSRTAQKQGDDAVACQRELGGAHGARKGFVVLVSVEELLPFRVEGTGVPEQLGRVPMTLGPKVLPSSTSQLFMPSSKSPFLMVVSVGSSLNSGAPISASLSSRSFCAASTSASV